MIESGQCNSVTRHVNSDLFMNIDANRSVAECKQQPYSFEEWNTTQAGMVSLAGIYFTIYKGLDIPGGRSIVLHKQLIF